MDNNDDSLDESQGSTKSVKGKRGVIWGNAETSALIKVWGEAEVKYALSSLKRNYEIFEMISTELGKVGYFRSAEECRTKTKSLRKLYKLAVLHNNRSGSGRSKFIWYDEMAQIFRTDASIHPLQTTESESSAEAGADSMDGSGELMVTLDLVEAGDVELSACSDTSGAGHQDSTNYEATLDPARRLAMLRKRKQRTCAAACLDNTLSGFVDWVQRNTEAGNIKRYARDDAEK
ncbi:hypothetical protein JRQ81_002474 [Phrynocephalus forsythii]|uniref:Myb/SANT-like DNA-binding domain-containing protein n=1 Tax=Phrynocephalus forsythii TaxID=171643 RepID=A0A9Q0XIF0_9SAUR|nr:hypothetical protein JRQ81_002474 [Phrynocephalus forsythii]